MAEYGTPPEVDRVAASRAAVAARRARAAVKAAIADGERNPLDVLRVAGEDPASVEGGIRVTEYLTSIPSIGVTKMHRFMEELGISPAKRLGGLGRHQRRRLRGFLTDRLAAQTGRSNRLVVLAGPDGRRQGHRRRRTSARTTPTCCSRCRRPPAPRAPARPRASATSSSTTPSSTVSSRPASCSSGRRCTTRTATAPRAGPSRRLSTPAAAFCSRSTSRVPARCAGRCRRRRWSSCCRRRWDELVRRLIGRATEDGPEQQRRLETAKVELAAIDEFDFEVVNSDVSTAAQEVVDLMQTRRPKR